MKFVLIEDDHMQAEWIKDELSENIENVVIKNFKTIENCKQNIDAIEKFNPDIIIIDIMMVYMELSEEIEKVEEANKDKNIEYDFYRAGFECFNSIKCSIKLKNIPIIIYTMLTKEDIINDLNKLKHKYYYLEKTESIEPLLQVIKNITENIE